jgi:peptidoglycan hydrolase CwlO-like protein
MEATWVWVFIPIVAILARVFRDYLRLQTQQRALGTSNRELEKVMEDLRQTNRTLAQRVENLETIVVSQTWNALNAPGASDAERQQKIAAAVRQEAHAPATDEMNRQRAEQLARRLGG